VDIFAFNFVVLPWEENMPHPLQTFTSKYSTIRPWGIFSSHANTTKLKAKLGVKFEIIIVKGKG